MTGPAAPRAWIQPQRLGRVAPLPFVGVSAILVALLIFTPVLLSTGTSLYLAQGQLIVLPSTTGTKFYLQPRDSQQVVYSSTTLSLGTGFVWNGSCPSTVTQWNNTTDTHGIEVNASTTQTPVLVYAEAVFAGSDGPVIFAGEFAFDTSGVAGPSPVFSLVACTTATPGVTVPPSPSAVTDQPITLYLADFGSGGPP